MNLVLLEELVEAFSTLPGIGKKTARRLALFVIESDSEVGSRLAKAITEAVSHIGRCPICGLYAPNGEKCHICNDFNRDNTIICVVSRPQDVLAIENSHSFSGFYHILGGNISPLDGIGPQDLRISELLNRIGDGKVTELILALDNTVDGDTTAHYISSIISTDVKVSRLAAGLPFGGELEYTDGVTISRAFRFRTSF